jgi:hypothetical protein
MGLDTTHGCWHGAYSAFMRWREKIAEVAGLPPLGMMEGFWDPRSPDRGEALTYTVAASSLERHGDTFGAESLRRLARRPAIRWDCLKPSPLHILLSHSDCDGSIAAGDCGPIADALEALLPLLEGDGGGHIGNYRAKTQTFIDGLRAAAAAGEDVGFH